MKKISNVYTTVAFGITVVFTPLVTRAETFRDFIADIVGLINVTIPVLIGAALVFYFWNVVTKIINKDSRDAKEKLGKIVPMGLLALFVLVSIWGILNILQNTFLGGS